MNKSVLFFLSLFFFPFIAVSQFHIQGKVYSSEDTVALVGATISNSNDSLLAITDEEGSFEVLLHAADELIVQHVGYNSNRIMVAEDSTEVTLMMDFVGSILDEVQVVSFETNRSLREVAGGIGIIQERDLRKFDATSLVPVMNQVPGVRMEQRSTGSYRISIRGSALRAPFDVRNVKVYWNNIPITEPGGNTPFNLLDNSNIGRIEVIKGPSGSIYGAGIGGVIDIDSDTPVHKEKHLSSSFTVGDFGLKRHTISANWGDDRQAVGVTYASQKVDGYREHSAFDRQNLEVTTSFKTGETSVLSTSILYTDLFYEIPGGLTQEQFDEAPSQARPGNPFVLGSEEANASIDVKNLLMGISYDTPFGNHAELLTTVYANLADFVNPFNLDYKREGQQGYGGRARANVYGSLGDIDTKLSLGGEYQFRFAAARNYGNDRGKPDTLNFDDELRTKQYMLFAQYAIFFPSDWILTAGLSANQVSYDIYRIADHLGANGSRINKDFDTQWMPRVSLVKTIDQATFYGSMSWGFSPPTLEEVRTNEGSINLSLEPEKGINYEAGVRGGLFGKKVSYDVTAFYFKLSESIVDYPSDRGTDLFRNAGSTNQRGIEAVVNYKAIDSKKTFISFLNFNVNYAYHHFMFDEYIQGENDYSNNYLTGVAPHTWWLGMDFETRWGLYGNLSYNYTDEIPLDDANTVYSDSYRLLLGKIGLKRELFENFIFDVYAGGDNLLNEKYSLGNDLNAFGGRYFQPAPVRNYYGGIALNYTF